MLLLLQVGACTGAGAGAGAVFGTGACASAGASVLNHLSSEPCALTQRLTQ